MRKLGQITGDHAAPVMRFEASCAMPCSENDPRRRAAVSVRKLELGCVKDYHCKGKIEWECLQHRPTLFVHKHRQVGRAALRSCSRTSSNRNRLVSGNRRDPPRRLRCTKPPYELLEEQWLSLDESICRAPYMALTSYERKDPKEPNADRAHSQIRNTIHEYRNMRIRVKCFVFKLSIAQKGDKHVRRAN